MKERLIIAVRVFVAFILIIILGEFGVLTFPIWIIVYVLFDFNYFDRVIISIIDWA